MRVSHVIRGNDHVNNTPKQILLYQAFGYNIPKFAHIPLVHGPDGSKLSKRKEEQYRKFGISVCVEEYQNMGYLPCALVNYFTRLGWSYGDQEIFSRDELIKLFDLKNIGISRSIMNPDKLRWLNAHYIKETPDSELAGLLVPVLSKMGVQVDANERIKRIAGCLKERTKTLEEMAHSAMFFFCAPEHYDTKAKDKWCVGHGDKILHAVRTVLASADTNDEKTMERSFRKIAYELGEGKLSKVVQPLRIALTGTSTSPPIFTVLSILGHEETLRRIDKALAEMKATL
jgi:glutamyl-tRNA synthetase